MISGQVFWELKFSVQLRLLPARAFRTMGKNFQSLQKRCEVVLSRSPWPSCKQEHQLRTRGAKAARHPEMSIAGTSPVFTRLSPRRPDHELAEHPGSSGKLQTARRTRIASNPRARRCMNLSEKRTIIGSFTCGSYCGHWAFLSKHGTSKWLRSTRARNRLHGTHCIAELLG